MSGKIVFVCGSPGAGKSSIVNAVSKSKKYRVVNVGTLMTELGIKKGQIKDRDEIRSMGVGKLDALQMDAFGKVLKMDGNIVLDTHATVEQNGRYVPGISADVIRKLRHVSALVYIDALTSDIVKRRKGDRTRRRENERTELIDVQRIMNIAVLSSCAATFNIPFYVIFNEQNSLDRCIGELKSHLDEVFGA